MIEFRQVTKNFLKNGTLVTALKKVSLTVHRGRILGVVGASGAGKSTLIRCVNGLEQPDSGEIVVDGQNISTLPEKNLILVRRRIGMIFQQFNLMASQTVFGNIAYPLKLTNQPRSVIDQRVSELLTLVQLEDKARVYPANLSGGQKQRVAIARALANSPQVLLCDEATSALDPASTRSILSLLKHINQQLGITILLITHEMDVVKSICDEVAILHEGELAELNTVGNLFSDPKTAIAKQFIDSALNIDLPESYRERLKQFPEDNLHPIVRIQLSGANVDAPVLSEAARLFEIDTHLVSARIDSAGSHHFGVMIAELRGNERSTTLAIDYLKQKNAHTTVLGYV